MKQEQFKQIKQWQEETFPNANPLSKIAHLKEEILEVEEAISNNLPSKKSEYADCFLLLFGAAASDGLTYDDICQAIDDKMEINKSRKWGKPNKLGVVNHIK